MFDAMLRDWEGESLVVHRDAPSGAWIFIAIHSTRLGPAAGGTRIKQYPAVEDALCDALRLSKGMTLKFAAPGLPYGGAKAVIMLPDDFEPEGRRELLRRYGEHVKALRGAFYTGPDFGTTPADMDVIAETGSPYIFCRTPEAGGAGDPGPYTAFGVLTGMRAVCEHLYGDDSLASRRILVQGAGDVGGALIPLLLAEGSEVTFSEVDDRTIHHFRDEVGVAFVPAGDALGVECDILAPCALGGVLDETTIPQLRCAAVAGSANNQLGTAEDAERLRSRGILYAPDYVVNSGGAMAITLLEMRGGTPEGARDEIATYVRRALLRIFETADREGITSDAAALRMAEEHLAGAVAA